jgi:hypothetical protein
MIMTRRVLWLAMGLTAASAAAAQQPRTVHGTVRLPSGEPVVGANVFVLETLDGALSDATGAFVLRTSAPAAAVLVAQRLGLRELRATLGTSDTVTLVLVPDAIALPGVNVIAGRFTSGSGPDAELTPIQAVSTPGAAADVYRALQSFPGLQAVDEGAGLFVRGGDVAETRVFLNEAVVLSPYRYESPTGGFSGAFDPFLLDGIYFSSGGFGARYGDALSGIAALRALGKPDRIGFGATASLAALSATAHVPIGTVFGARGTLTRSNTHLLFRLNGTSTEFTHEPEGRDASITGAAKYRSGELRFFAIEQWSRLGVFVTEPSFAGALDSDGWHRSQVLTWEQRLGGTRLTLVGSKASAQNRVRYGALDLEVDDRLRQLRALAEAQLSDRVGLSAGVELMRRAAGFTGRIPRRSHDDRPDAPTDMIDVSIGDTHRAAFLETDWKLRDGLRVIAGVRADRARRTGHTTVDPRVSLAYRAAESLTLTAAWGIYHQAPNPQFYDPHFGGAELESMRAEHRVLGLQAGESAGGGLLVRFEAYDKRYHDLAEFDRDRRVHAGGTGDSRGVDLFVRWPRWRRASGRTSYSFVRARRTDPNTGIMARSPFDITHVVTSVIDYTLGEQLHIGIAHRYATGRPFTPILGAQPDRRGNVWVPAYGPPMSERLPSFQRVDVSLSRMIPLPSPRLLVLFAAVNNILDRKNIYDYRYNEDYSERTPVRSQFERSVYFGATFTW